MKKRRKSNLKKLGKTISKPGSFGPEVKWPVRYFWYAYPNGLHILPPPKNIGINTED